MSSLRYSDLALVEERALLPDSACGVQTISSSIRLIHVSREGHCVRNKHLDYDRLCPLPAYDFYVVLRVRSNSNCPLTQLSIGVSTYCSDFICQEELQVGATGASPHSLSVLGHLEVYIP
eukprot:4472933-Amphidinium_carterae.2